MKKQMQLSLVQPQPAPLALDLVLIPAGSFTMGDAENSPAHKVTLTKPFYMGKYAVTQEQYQQVMGINPSRFKGKNNPVEMVFWNDAQEFCKLLSASSGQAVRLPTEAEWEYACRAGSKNKFCFGNDEGRLGEYAWFYNNSRNTTHPVGQKKPNKFGLYDMHGNVWEWCTDWYGDYPAKAVNNPNGPANGAYRVLRGGSWDDAPWNCWSANRGGGFPVFRFYLIGFRVVLVPSSRTS